VRWPFFRLRQAGALLGIVPKTLHHWVQQANCSVYPHPSDARVKCLAFEQIEQLAALHGRPLDQSTLLSEVHSAETAPPLPPEKPASQADLRSRLVHLEAQVALLQQQVAGLTLELLQERTARVSAPPASAGGPHPAPSSAQATYLCSTTGT
jgi:hypothetical protein